MYKRQALSTIANGGTLMRPYLVSKIVDSDGVVVKEFEPEPIRQVISNETSRELSLILESVVVNGSGFRAQVPGYRVGGKTGTAEKPEGGRYTDKRVSSFLGFAPVEDPRMAILVIWDEPNAGTSYGCLLYTSAPTFQAIVKDVLRYMEVSPSVPQETKTPDPGTRQVIVPNVIGLNPVSYTHLDVYKRQEGIQMVPAAARSVAKSNGTTKRAAVKPNEGERKSRKRAGLGKRMVVALLVTGLLIGNLALRSHVINTGYKLHALEKVLMATQTEYDRLQLSIAQLLSLIHI